MKSILIVRPAVLLNDYTAGYLASFFGSSLASSLTSFLDSSLATSFNSMTMPCSLTAVVSSFPSSLIIDSFLVSSSLISSLIVSIINFTQKNYLMVLTLNCLYSHYEKFQSTYQQLQKTTFSAK